MKAPTLARDLAAAYWSWFEAPELDPQTHAIGTLEEIRRVHGPGWAIFASAFCHGRLVRAWRRDLIAEIDEAMT